MSLFDTSLCLGKPRGSLVVVLSRNYAFDSLFCTEFGRGFSGRGSHSFEFFLASAFVPDTFFFHSMIHKLNTA